MSIIDTLAESLGFISKEKAASPTVMSSSGGDPFAIWRGSKKVDVTKAFDVYTGWVYACIRAIGEEIQKMDLELYEIKKGGEEERILEHEVLDLLAAPNPQTTGIEMLFSITAHLEMVGNAYLYLDGVSSEKSKPTAIYLLDASRVRVIINDKVFPHVISHYEYRGKESTWTFEPYQIAHIKYPDPSNPFEGIGTVQTAAQWIDADNYAMEFNRRFFLNGARIGGYLEAQQAWSTDQLEYMKKSFEAAHRGIDNAYKTMALPQGTKYVAAGESQKDMDFAEMMTMMRDRILAAFRVPRTALGITDDVNRANAEATDYVFAARTIVPKMAIITSYLNEYIVPRFGDRIYLSFKDPVPENQEQTMREMAIALGNAPAISVNEARERYFGADPIENGDDVMAPFSMTPLGAPSQKKSMNKPATRGAKMVKPSKSKGARNAEKRSAVAEALAQAAAEELKKVAKAVKKAKKKKNLGEMSDDDFEPIYKAFFSRVSGFEQKMESVIKSHNADQEKTVLENLESAVKTVKKAVDKDDLLDDEYEVGALVDLSMPIMEDLYSKEGKEAAALLGFDIDPLTKETKKALERSMKLMSETYTDETLRLLKEKLEYGISEGLGLNELKNIVKDVYAFNDEVRALRVARTEVFRVANEGAKEAWKETGVVKTIKWYTAADERVCEWCEPMHGKTVGIEENFFDKGDTVTASDGKKVKLEYADVSAGALHANCRCYTRPDQISLE